MVKNDCVETVQPVFEYFNSDTLLNLYNTLVYPYVNYCIQIWGNAAKLHLEKLHILQKKIIRIISGVPRKTHSKPLFEKLKVLTIYQAYNYSVGVFMYKLFHFMLPPIFVMFKRTSDIHNYSTRQEDSFYLQFVPTHRSQKTIKISGTKLWNSLYDKVNTKCKIGTFKNQLKTFLLS